MTTLDWIFVVGPILLVIAIAAYTHRFTRSVADFLSGGRLAGRYLLANARGESDSGLANTMSKFEIIMVSGFVLNFWEKVSVPVLLLIGITGFVVYRFRETRALTLAQFFEQRYSRRYRLFMGALAFISGILNYGIFPAISSRFFVYFLGLPVNLDLIGFAIPTAVLIMAVYLAATVALILIGGQVTLMVTDCVEGILSHAVYIAIVISVFWIVGWGHIVETMSMTPPDKSLINPFDAHEVEDFNIWFVLMVMLISVYTTMALQNKQGFNSAARTPHESRMGHVLGHWRNYARLLMLLALGLCVTTYIRHPDFVQQAQPIHDAIAQIDAGRVTQPITETVGSQEWFENKNVPQLQKQMAAPVALSYLLPVGIKGLFLAIMIMGLVAGDSGHLHSWGSIFVQDVVLPLRKKPMSTRGHMWALRGAVTFVAAFAFFFSIVYAQSQYIALWWALTGGVFVCGAGAAIIGGLYWRRGTAQGAWAATLSGSTIALFGIACTSNQIWPTVQSVFENVGIAMPAKFWLNGQQTAFLAACMAVAVYVTVSLLTTRGRGFDLDAMLHRKRAERVPLEGEIAEPLPALETAPIGLRDRFRLRNILKFDSNFTFADKVVSGGIFWWSMLLLAINLFVCIWNVGFGHWPISWWSTYWAIFGIGLPFAIAFITLIWFGIGGLIDIRHFFRDLRVAARDATDDGTVRGKDEG
jgi:SSS family solute:Na+ symporter